MQVLAVGVNALRESRERRKRRGRRKQPSPSAPLVVPTRGETQIQIVARELTPLAEAQQSTATAADVVRRLLESLRPNTLSTYRRGLVAFAEWCGFPAEGERYKGEMRTAWHARKRALELECINRAAAGFLDLTGPQAEGLVEKWIRVMEREKVAPKTIAVRISAVRKLSLLGGRPLVTKAPEAQALKDTRGPVVDAVRKLLHACDDTPTGRRNRVIVMLLGVFGIRRAGVVGLRHADYDRAGQRLRVVLKGGKEKWYGLHATPKCVEAIERWLEVSGETRPRAALIHRLDAPGVHLSLGGFNHIVRELSAKAGIKAGPHGLRHFAGTTTAEKLGPRYVQKLLGHSSLATSQLYMDEREDMAAVAAGVNEKELMHEETEVG